MKQAEKAIENHKKFMSCSASVLCAFRDTAGLSEEEALQIAKQYAGGRMGTCGAVLAAKDVLSRKFGADDPRVAALEAQFTERNRTALCRELKGGLTGKPLRSCRGCVTDAAELLEQLLAEGEPVCT